MPKTKTQYIQGLLNIVLILLKSFNIFQDAKRFVFNELKLAGRNVFAILCYGILFSLLLCFAWICLMAIIYLKIVEYSSPMMALVSIFGLHLFMILLVGFLYLQAKNAFYLSYKRKTK